MIAEFEPGQVWEDSLGRRLVITAVHDGVVSYHRLPGPDVRRARRVELTTGWSLVLDVEGSNVL